MAKKPSRSAKTPVANGPQRRRPKEPLVKPPFLQSIRIRNLLSFGPDSEEIKLGPLNVLIGPNGCGKSNFIEAIGLLQAAPKGIMQPISDGGGIEAWLWKGAEAPVADILSNVVDVSEAPRRNPPEFHCEHHLRILGQSRSGIVRGEVEAEKIVFRHRAREMVLERRPTFPEIKYWDPDEKLFKLKNERDDPSQSIMSMVAQWPETENFADMANLWSRVQIYRGFSFNSNKPPRTAVRADEWSATLAPDASNLALILNHLWHQPKLKKPVLERLQKFYEGVRDITFLTNFGQIQFFFEEEGLASHVPASRLSDGTLRYLCLLMILCQPQLPPLICIEGPEEGLHPDMLHDVAELLVEASQRTQLIVTTHSDILVDALGQAPGSIFVCSKNLGGTSMERLEPEKLKWWLERYTLGELWRIGELGGNRW